MNFDIPWNMGNAGVITGSLSHVTYISTNKYLHTTFIRLKSNALCIQVNFWYPGVLWYPGV